MRRVVYFWASVSLTMIFTAFFSHQNILCVEVLKPKPQVSVSDSGFRTTITNYPGHEGHQFTDRSMSINTGKIRYGIKYCACTDKAHGENVAPQEGYIGMPEPCSENWYHSGFLFLYINGKDVGKTRIKDVQVTEEGERGGVDMVWETAEARVRIRFIALPDDDKIFVQIGINPKKEVNSIRVMTRCYPSFFTAWHKQKGERTIATALKEARGREPETPDLDPNKEWWILYYDKIFDVAKNKGIGPCAMLYLPQEVRKVKLNITNYPVETFLDYRSEVKTIRLVFWEFPNKANREALNYMKRKAGKTKAELENLSFINLRVAGFDLNKEKKEISDLIAQVPDKTQEFRSEFENLHSQMEEILTKLQGQLKSGEPTDIDMESKFLDLIKTYEALKWELKFFVLLNA